MDGKMSQLKARNPGEMMPCRPFYDVSQSIMWKDVCYRMMYTEDDIPKLLKNKDYRKALVSLGLFETLPTDDEVRTLMSYALFHPMSDITTYSDKFVQNLHKYPSIGVQIRTGGSLASDSENNVFFSQSTMYRVIDMINEVITENYIFDYNLFVSTDSQELLTELKTIFPQLVHTSDNFKIGHTSALRNPDGVNHGYRALIDLMILSSCDYLIYTEDSTYGRLASVMSFSEHKYTVSHK